MCMTEQETAIEAPQQKQYLPNPTRKRLGKRTILLKNDLCKPKGEDKKKQHLRTKKNETSGEGRRFHHTRRPRICRRRRAPLWTGYSWTAMRAHGKLRHIIRNPRTKNTAIKGATRMHAGRGPKAELPPPIGKIKFSARGNTWKRNLRDKEPQKWCRRG